jgi:hypothetical protein
MAKQTNTIQKKINKNKKILNKTKTPKSTKTLLVTPRQHNPHKHLINKTTNKKRHTKRYTNDLYTYLPDHYYHTRLSIPLNVILRNGPK